MAHRDRPDSIVNTCRGPNWTQGIEAHTGATLDCLRARFALDQHFGDKTYCSGKDRELSGRIITSPHYTQSMTPAWNRMDDASVAFFIDGEPHGPLREGVTGAVKLCVSMGSANNAVRIL